MSRKNAERRARAADASSTPAASGGAGSTGSGSFKPPVAVLVVIVLLVAVAGLALFRTKGDDGGQPAAAAAPEPASATPESASVTPVAETVQPPLPTAPPKPGAKGDLPPIPLGTMARPIEVVKAVYEFAGRHPEVLQYVPCYCGCEAMGHKGNDDCFVSARNADGSVRSWEPHGIGCAICLDVGQQAMQMYAAGADVKAIRAAIERRWSPMYHTHTPTPVQPPTEQ